MSHLVRRSIRDGARVRHETIANISRLPADAIEALTLALRGVRLLPVGEAFRITRSGADRAARLAPQGRLDRAAVRRPLSLLCERRPRRQSNPLRRRRAQSANQTHLRRATLPLARKPARGARHPRPQHHPTAGTNATFAEASPMTPPRSGTTAGHRSDALPGRRGCRTPPRPGHRQSSARVRPRHAARRGRRRTG